MTIDVHAHTVAADHIERMKSEAPKLAPRIELDGSNCTFVYDDGRRSGPMPIGMFDHEERIKDMDAMRIDVQALSVPPTHFNYHVDAELAALVAASHNDSMIAMAEASPDRFVVLATLPMQSADFAIAELSRLAQSPHVVGVELATNVAGVNLDAPELDPIWAAIALAGMPIVLHPHDVVEGTGRMKAHYLHNFVGNPTDTTLAAGSLMFGGVLTRHPRLRFGLLHGGGFLPYQIGRLDHGWSARPEPKVHLPVAPSTLLKHFWFDSLTHDDQSLALLINRMGAERVFLGSDYPFDMADMNPVQTVERVMGLDNPELGKVLHETATTFLAPLAAEVTHL
jgi:aminocarboxymuconate-semialdehyde decarboxylase